MVPGDWMKLGLICSQTAAGSDLTRDLGNKLTVYYPCHLHQTFFKGPFNYPRKISTSEGIG